MTPLSRLVYRPEFMCPTGQDPQSEAPIVRNAQDGGAAGPGTPIPGGTAPGGTAEPAGQRPPAPSMQESCMDSLPMFLGIGLIMYFLLIRPQQKQEKARKALLAAIKVGDDVVTSGGLHGTISGMSETTVTLRVDTKVKMTVDRANIARVVGGDGEAKATS